jgi:2-methylisocitrate lyase-like PEP mutase family enzyme
MACDLGALSAVRRTTRRLPRTAPESIRCVGACVDKGPNGAARIVPAPPDCELGRAEIADRNADNARAVIHSGVSLRYQGDRRAGRNNLELLVGGRHLGGDDRRSPGPLVGGEPELAQRARCARKSDERLGGDVGELDLPPSGEGVPGAEGGIAPFGDQYPDGDVIRVERQPQERGVGGVAAKAGGRVRPAERPKLKAPAGLAFAEVIDHAGIKVAADRGKRPNPQLPYLGGGGIGDGGGPRIPTVKQRPGDVQQCPPGRGERDMTAVASKQLRPQRRLQAPNLLAERRLGDMQPLRGPGEVQLFRHGDEITQVTEMSIQGIASYRGSVCFKAMTTQTEKAGRFLDLHRPGNPLLLPNPWDQGSAKLLASLGFRALATTSSGFAATLGRLDGSVSRDEALAHAAAIVVATELPVSADLENCFADDPGGVARTVTLAAETGLAGCSVEDFTGDDDEPVYDIALAAERVAAAAEAAHAGPARLVLTARAENYLHGRPDLADTITRLQAYQAAGADVLYAPGLTSLADIRQVVTAVDRPVNVLAMSGAPPVSELAEAGVSRVSVGGAFAFAALGALAAAATELRDKGTYGYLANSAAGNRAVQRAVLALGQDPGVLDGRPCCHSRARVSALST